jgi:hypothetical protein
MVHSFRCGDLILPFRYIFLQNRDDALREIDMVLISTQTAKQEDRSQMD